MSERYSQLAPLSIDLRINLAIQALIFFGQVDPQNIYLIIEKEYPGVLDPMDSFDFLKYLKKKQILEDPMKYTSRIRELLERMATVGLLTEMGYGRNVMLPKKYHALGERSKARASGLFWLVPALGADFLYRLASPAVVHIIGKLHHKNNGGWDEQAGTGIVFAPNHILTCAHVVNGVALTKGQTFEVNETQTFQGIECRVEQCFVHQEADVAVIRVDQPLTPAPGLSFLPPEIAQPVFTLGYSLIPEVNNTPVTMQRGEVTNESVTTRYGNNFFLYSAIARPGNSGGPILSNDGYIVGITSRDLVFDNGKNPFSPHYAGISTQEIARCLDELDIGVQIPIEDFS